MANVKLAVTIPESKAKFMVDAIRHASKNPDMTPAEARTWATDRIEQYVRSWGLGYQEHLQKQVAEPVDLLAE